ATSRATSSWSASGDTLTTLGSRIAHTGVVRPAVRRRRSATTPPRRRWSSTAYTPPPRRAGADLRIRSRASPPAPASPTATALEQRLDGLHAPGGLFHRAYRSHR